jgi:hypothetical protein
MDGHVGNEGYRMDGLFERDFIGLRLLLPRLGLILSLQQKYKEPRGTWIF